MATITQLSACCFLENIPQIEVSEIEAGTPAVSVSFDGTTLLQNLAMTPDKNGMITIHARQMIRNMAALTGPKNSDTVLPKLSIRCTGPVTAAIESHIVPGGINSSKNVGMEWFARNFLTWQPQIIETTPAQPQWLAFVPLPGYGIYTIKSTLYAENGETFSKEVCVVMPGYRYVQIDTSFAALWREFCIEKKILPLCYDVCGSIMVQEPAMNEGLDRKLVTQDDYPYAQRYRLRQDRHDDVCFGFVNTLGGFDTLMMQGKTILKPEGDVETFTNSEVEKELTDNYTSYWDTSTGYIDSERMAAQYQDFIKSRDRWVYRDSEWHRIIVDEYKVEHAARELNAYTFKYHLAERNERRFYEREELPEPQIIPGEFFPECR